MATTGSPNTLPHSPTERLLVINTDRQASHSLMLSTESELYTLDAASLSNAEVRLNGAVLRLGAGDELPAIQGAPVIGGPAIFGPTTITFLAIPTAANSACR